MSTSGTKDLFQLSENEGVDFDPLEDLTFENDIDDDADFETSPYAMPNPDSVSRIKGEPNSFANKETPQERIEALFDQMPTLQKILYSILGECAQPAALQPLENIIEEQRKHHHSVYSPSTFCTLLEQAGAIEKTDGEGNPLSTKEQEPIIIEIDGEDYWKVAPAPDVFWLITDAGREKLQSHRPLEIIGHLYEEEPQYAEVFTTVLQMCARENGSSVKQISDVVDDEPVLQDPRRYAMYFIDKLEHAGALDWSNSWIITDFGREFLEALKDAR